MRRGNRGRDGLSNSTPVDSEARDGVRGPEDQTSDDCNSETSGKSMPLPVHFFTISSSDEEKDEDSLLGKESFGEKEGTHTEMPVLLPEKREKWEERESGSIFY